MIQFLGIDFSETRVSAAVIGRDLSLTCEVSTPIANVRGEAGGGVSCLKPTEWLRAGAYAAQEAYFGLPVSSRKLWGIGLSSAAGWIALDHEFEPLCDVRLLPAEAITSDLRRWLDDNPRLPKRVSTILSAKDYFRFAISGALAADVTLSSRQGLLEAGERDWSAGSLEEKGISARWLPPVFDSHVPTGRISEEGMRRTGLPGGLWLVAGALSSASAMVASGDLRAGVLWAPAGRGLLAYGVQGGTALSRLPPGFSLWSSAIEGRAVLETPIGDTNGARLEELLMETTRDLEAVGLPVSRVEREPGRSEIGAAVLAGMGSGLLRSWDWYYRQVSAQKAPARQESAENATAPDRTRASPPPSDA